MSDTPSLHDRALPVADLLKTLAHPARLVIACALVEQARSVGELEQALDIHQPGLSRHLASLRAARVVSCRREGQSMIYHLANDKVGQLIMALHTIFCASEVGTSPAIKPEAV
ncbi:MAG: metalloregulator ArsR/SmtB family transcription factor [Acetobacter papayae]